MKKENILHFGILLAQPTTKSTSRRFTKSAHLQTHEAQTSSCYEKAVNKVSKVMYYKAVTEILQ